MESRSFTFQLRVRVPGNEVYLSKYPIYSVLVLVMAIMQLVTEGSAPGQIWRIRLLH